MPGERVSRVLLIDDDPSVGDMLQMAFKEQGYEFQAVTTAADGLSAAMQKPPTLILLSTMLPDQSGLQVFHALRERTRTAHIPIMFLAGRGAASQQNDVLMAGADDFIAKPFDIDILSLRVRNAIKRVERDGLHHPRSGLATGRLILERVRALADEYDWVKIDFTIDSFATFRELYGFMTGEEVLIFTANLITETVQAEGTPDDFVGHRDDTEFVIVTTSAKAPALLLSLEKRFNEGVLAFYNFMEREQGYVEVDDGSGGREQKPLMSARIKVQQGESE